MDFENLAQDPDLEYLFLVRPRVQNALWIHRKCGLTLNVIFFGP